MENLPPPIRPSDISNIRAENAGKRSTLLYILAILIVTFIGAVSVLMVLYLNPGGDNMQIIVTIFGFLTPVLLFLFTLINQLETKIKVEENRIQGAETHDAVNSRMTEMKVQIERLAYEEGRRRGIEQERELMEKARLLTAATTQTPLVAAVQPSPPSETTPPITLPATVVVTGVESKK